jgi:hypothetical protein
MASGSGKNPNTSQGLLNYEPMTCNVVYAGEEFNYTSATVYDSPKSIPNSFLAPNGS